MKRESATFAIVVTRLRRLSVLIGFIALVAFLFAALQFRAGVAMQLIGATLFGSASGILVAILQRGSQMRDLELCEQSAPLYAREIARAIALIPCIAASCAVGAYWIIAGFSPGAHALAVAGSLASVNAITPVALCATLRLGWRRWLYIAIAASLSGLLTAIQLREVPAALLLSGITGFIGLRQYGEALARWDPISLPSV
ncbi:MAG TPA: hypothetical protein VGR69_01505 [Candidatus Rubrimentiphilum sp.]|nr:hypothetical protein [Candidatus Rubrimentiphilum sp.]